MKHVKMTELCMNDLETTLYNMLVQDALKKRKNINLFKIQTQTKIYSVLFK